jgi:broad specificity phosphatase PhoE
LPLSAESVYHSGAAARQGTRRLRNPGSAAVDASDRPRAREAAATVAAAMGLAQLAGGDVRLREHDQGPSTA